MIPIHRQHGIHLHHQILALRAVASRLESITSTQDDRDTLRVQLAELEKGSQRAKQLLDAIEGHLTRPRIVGDPSLSTL